MARYTSGPIIENEAAYEAAIRARIANNRRKTAMKKWEALEDKAELGAFLERRASAQVKDRYFSEKGLPLSAARELPFIDACWLYLIEGGCLMDGQLAALRRMIAQAAERKAEAAKRDAGSQHIGTVGERRSFTLTIAFTASFDGMYGMTYITGFKDDAGNVIVYKGSKELGERGATITFKATIKEHGVREGVKQTYLTRPVLG